MLGLRKGRGLRRGDTIVEVLFAVTVFSLVAVAGISLMNKGLSTSQRSLEITAVRQQIDGQAEALRFLHGSYVDAYRPGFTNPASSPAGKYQTILNSHLVTTASTASTSTTCVIPTSSKFVIDTKTGAIESSPAKFRLPDTYARLTYSETATPTLTHSEGVWVEGVRSTAASSGGVGFVDFHIRACWDAPGQSVPTTLRTIVRLYDPR